MSLTFRYNQYNKTTLILDSDVGVCYHILWPIYEIKAGIAYVAQKHIWAKNFWSHHPITRVC